MPISPTGTRRAARPPARYLKKVATAKKDEGAAALRTRSRTMIDEEVVAPEEPKQKADNKVTRQTRKGATTRARRSQASKSDKVAAEDEDQEDEVDDDSVDPKPTAAQFQSWKSYKQARIAEPGLTIEESTFAIGDTIFVLPEGLERSSDDPCDDQLWFGKIEAIRSPSGANAWFKVSWFYRPDEFHEVATERKRLEKDLKSFDKEYCGKRELILSNHEDFVPITACDGQLTVSEYDEYSLDQRPISESSYFYRSEYRFPKAKGGKGNFNAPRPSCFCKEPYSPDDLDGIMRYCPTKCQRWYHETCLKKYPSTEDKYAKHLQESLDPYFEPSNPSPSKKRRLTSGSPSKRSTRAHDDDEAIPSLLLSLAQTPVVRGGPFGLVGNAFSVLRSREMIAAEEWEKWEEETEAALRKKDRERGEKAKKRGARTCKCGNVI